MGSNTVEQEYRVARKETDSRRLEALHSYDYKKGNLQPEMVIDVRDYDSLVRYIKYLEEEVKSTESHLDYAYEQMQGEDL